MLSYRFDATRGSSAVDWRMASGGQLPLDPPEPTEYWEIESDKRDDEHQDDFLTSVELD